MAGEGLNIDKLREYLRALTPEARAMLMAALERGALRGENTAGTNLVFQELRKTLRGSVQSAARGDNPSRRFFAPLEPFLINDAPQFAHEGRLARPSLSPIWEWICRDLAPEEAKTYIAEMSRLLVANQELEADAAARAFQDLVVQRVYAALGAARTDDKAKRQLSAQIGTPRALDDVYRLASILRARDAISALAGRLPSSIKNLTGDRIQALKPLLDTTSTQRELFTFAIILVMSRLQHPWQLIRFATKAAGSDDAVRVAETNYAVAVTIVLQDMERMVRTLSEDIRRGQAAARPMLLKTIHDAARGLRSEINMTGDMPWARRLAAIRTEVAGLLRGEVESAAGRVRRLLRPTKDIAPGATLDPGEVSDTENLIAYVGACRNFASELAISEMTQRAWSEIRQYLETNAKSLVESLRTAGEADRAYRESVVDATVRFCQKVFGQEFADLLARAAELAAASDRKAARA